MLLRDVGNKTNFALDMYAVFGKHVTYLLYFKKVKYDHFCWGVQIREGGSKSASEYGLPGVQIR